MADATYVDFQRRQTAREKDRGGDPPDNGDMEARVSRLEEFATNAGERLARIETKLDQVSHDTGQFKWFLLGAVLTMLLTVIGTSIAIQQMTVSTFVAAAQMQAQAAQPTQPASAKRP